MDYPYSIEVEERMYLFSLTLNERDLRRYAGLEAMKLGHGGIKYISQVLKMTEKTVSKGLEEVKKNV
jgi:hypothetical protein